MSDTAEFSNLDLLRAFAVLTVYSAHLFAQVSGRDDLIVMTAGQLGRTGVLIFFVHTALVLMMSLERSERRHESLFLGFYLRRAWRIYPLSAICILTAVALRIPAFPRGQYEWIGTRGLLANVALVQNITGSRDVLSPLWSLPWEVQMYAVLPLVYLLGKDNRPLFVMCTTWGVAVAVRFASMYYSWPLGAALDYSPCFMSGAIAYQMCRRYRGMRAPAFLWPVWIVCVLFFHNLLWAISPIAKFRVSAYLACLVLGVTIPLFREMPNGLVARWAQGIARYSYGIYLFHIPIFWLAFVQCAGAPQVVRWTMCVALTCLIPMVFYHTVESPLIGLGRWCAHRVSSRESPQVVRRCARQIEESLPVSPEAV